MAAPASPAPIAASAISLAVIGKYGDIVGVWIEPVTAQVMTTFLLIRAFLPYCDQAMLHPLKDRVKRGVSGSLTATRNSRAGSITLRSAARRSSGVRTCSIPTTSAGT